MLDTITGKLRTATIKEAVQPVCCFKTCGAKGVAIVAARYKDGSTDLYVLCASDLLRVQDKTPGLDKVSRQGVFLYP